MMHVNANRLELGVARETVFWEQLRRILWAVSAALIVGACLYAWFGTQAVAFAVVVAAVAAISAGIGEKPHTRAKVSPDGVVPDELSVLSPLSRELLERLPDPLMLVNGGERILIANTAMRDIVGVNVERKHISAVLRNPAILEALTRTAATGVSGSVEFVSRVPIERHYQAYTTRVASEPSVVMLLMHDHTAIKRTEQMRVDFIANASHELRTPLAAVTGFIETLKGPAKDDTAARERFLDIMAIEAERMRRLIEDLLSLTRIELNEHVPPRGVVSAEQVVRQAATALVPLAKAEGITVSFDVADKLPEVIGERDELVQLFQNLIHNAIKYGRENGEVKITLKAANAPGKRGPESMVTVSVKDDGEGIPAEAIPRLTERFYRVDVKRSREKGGTGLGLAIVKHIINRHNGRMQIESRVGEGSTFIITLPAKRPADAPVTELL